MVKGTTIGTTASPPLALNDAEYYWRVRAIDSDGNAGVWNEGPRFAKGFDTETPTIRNLRMVNLEGNTVLNDPTTGTPIVTWSPVPGAASYVVEIKPRFKPEQPTTIEYTATPTWTALSSSSQIVQPGWPSPQSSELRLEPGEEYCVDVAARSDVDAFGKQIESALTPEGCPEFTFKYDPRPVRCAAALQDEKKGEQEAAEREYDANGGSPYEELEPTKCKEETGPTTSIRRFISPQPYPYQTRTPLFTWEPVPSADCYYIAISRQVNKGGQLQDVADVAYTYGTAYAPPVGGEEPLDDETTTYYWTVYPAAERKCTNNASPIVPEGRYAVFNKSSIPPTPLAPANGAEISNQPTFKWAPTEGALNYTIEVSQDPNSANSSKKRRPTRLRTRRRRRIPRTRLYTGGCVGTT